MLQTPFTSASVLSQISYRSDISILHDITVTFCGSILIHWAVRLECRPRGILQAKANGHCFRLVPRWRYFRRVFKDETVSPGRTQVPVVCGKYCRLSAGTCIQALPIASTPVPRHILPRNSRPAFGLKTAMSESRSAPAACPLAEVSEIRGNVTQPKADQIYDTTPPPRGSEHH